MVVIYDVRLSASRGENRQIHAILHFCKRSKANPLTYGFGIGQCMFDIKGSI